MKPLQWKEFFRCIRKTKSRFISMLLITALGVAFYVGIRSSGPDMELSADAYYDQNNLMDIRVLGTLGVTEDDVAAVQAIEGISEAQGGYSFDAICPIGNTEYIATVFSLCDSINRMSIEQGRLPETVNECYMDSWFMRNAGLHLGDTITLVSGTDNPLSDTLSGDTFTIVGCGSWSWYLSWERGTTDIGNGNINFFLGLLPEAFSMDAYTVIYASTDSLDSLNCYSAEYENAVSQIIDRIENIADQRCAVRYQEITGDALTEINDAQREIDDAQLEIDEGWIELEEARQKLEDAQREILDGEQELNDARQEIIDGEKELVDGERQIGEGRNALISGQAELREQIALFEKAKSEFESGQRELNEQKRLLDSKQTEVLNQKTELERQLQTLSAQEAELLKQKAPLEATKADLLSQKEALIIQQTELTATLNDLNAQREALLVQKASVEQALGLYSQESDLEKQRSELIGQLASVESGLLSISSERAPYDSTLAELKINRSSLDAELSELTLQHAQLDQQQTQLQKQAAALTSAREAIDSLNWSDWLTVAGYQAMTDSISSAGEDLASQAVRSVCEAVRSAVQASLGADNTLTDSHLAAVVPGAASAAVSSVAHELELQSSGLSAAQSELSAAQHALDTTLEACRSQHAELVQKITELEAALSIFSEKEKELTGAKSALTAGLAEIDTALSQIDAAISSIGKTPEELASALALLNSGLAQIDANLPALKAGLAQISEGLSQINAGISQIDAGLSEINSYLAQVTDGQKQISEGLVQINDGLSQINEAYQLIASSQSALNSGRSQLEDGEAQIADAQRLLYDKQRELEDGEAAINDARRQLADGRQQLEDGLRELADGKKEYNDGLADYQQGLADYNEAVAEAQPELEDARKKLADAREQLDELGIPEWYVLDRNSIQTFVEYGMDADRITAVGDVFPVLFFLVAALVCLTGMTRMVEEERIQIGTFKALGYSNGMIAAKYFLYSFLASLTGSIMGILVGSSVLPFVVMNAYGMLYSTLTELLSPINWSTAISAVLIAVSCIVTAAMSACFKTLRETPAGLMRPTSPPKGKRVFLEYIRPLWRRMSFAQKAAARNLFRYKKRLFMTVFGIAGCMALLIVGYGLKDSIQKIVDTQYLAVWTYDASLTADADDLEAIRTQIQMKESSVNEILTVSQKALDVQSSDRTVEAYLFVPQTTVGIENFVHFVNRVSRETYELDDSGVIITEKLASLLNLRPGDSITLCRSETERFDVPILAVSENYLYHYVYMTPSLHESLFGEKPEFTQLFFRTEKLSEEESLIFSERLLTMDAVKSVSLVSSLQASVADMMNAMNLVIWVLIIAAGLLAFVVLFNLNSISILERRRELATLRVLGFYDGELAAYLYRENVVLTLLGIAAGVLLGVPLHSYIIGTLELDMIMFGRVIQPLSYLASVLMTIFFACIVNFGMFFTLRKIDMVESLKSVE